VSPVDADVSVVEADVDVSVLDDASEDVDAPSTSGAVAEFDSAEDEAAVEGVEVELTKGGYLASILPLD
jgi:hypothetical protein